MMQPNNLHANQDLVSHYLGKWQTLEKYRLQEQSLGMLFKEFCPENRQIEHILLKACALNDFYSTNIFDTYSVAKHILDRDIDSRLRSGDCSLVNEVAKVSIKGKTKNFYSFASKYCSHHEPDKYPIYDFFVEKMLLHHKQDGFDAFRASDLKDYESFVRIIGKFREFYGLKSRFSLRDIDIYLWIAGKEQFKRTYS